MTASVHGRGLSVLIRDPWCIFLFWNDCSLSAMEETSPVFSDRQSVALLLVQNHTTSLLQKISVTPCAHNYYLPVSPGERYTITLGWSASGDVFQPCAGPVELSIPVFSSAAGGIHDDPASSLSERFFYPRFSLNASPSSSGEGR